MDHTTRLPGDLPGRRTTNGRGNTMAEDYQEAKARRERREQDLRRVVDDLARCERRGYATAAARKRREIPQAIAFLVEAAQQEGEAAADPATVCEVAALERPEVARGMGCGLAGERRPSPEELADRAVAATAPVPGGATNGQDRAFRCLNDYYGDARYQGSPNAEGTVTVEGLDGEEARARWVVDKHGHVVGAWDPDRLLDSYDAAPPFNTASGVVEPDDDDSRESRPRVPGARRPTGLQQRASTPGGEARAR